MPLRFTAAPLEPTMAQLNEKRQPFDVWLIQRPIMLFVCCRSVGFWRRWADALAINERSTRSSDQPGCAQFGCIQRISQRAIRLPVQASGRRSSSSSSFSEPNNPRTPSLRLAPAECSSHLSGRRSGSTLEADERMEAIGTIEVRPKWRRKVANKRARRLIILRSAVRAEQRLP